MSEFHSESSGEGWKASSENSKLDKENKVENSVDKAPEYRDFIEQQRAKSTTEKNKSDLRIWGNFCTSGMSSESFRQYPGSSLIRCFTLSSKMSERKLATNTNLVH